MDGFSHVKTRGCKTISGKPTIKVTGQAEKQISCAKLTSAIIQTWPKQMKRKMK